MKRQTFLGLLAGIFAAPFIKRNEIILPPPMKLQSFEKATFTNSEERNAEFMKELTAKYEKIWFNCKFEIKGEDLYVKPNNREG